MDKNKFSNFLRLVASYAIVVGLTMCALYVAGQIGLIDPKQLNLSDKVIIPLISVLVSSVVKPDFLVRNK